MGLAKIDFCSPGRLVFYDVRFVRMLRGFPGQMALYKHAIDQLATLAISAVAGLLV